MAENIAYAILGRIGKYLVDPIVLRLGYLFCFNNNIENLKDQVQKLETMRDGVQVQVDAARRNVEIVGNDVEEWMTSVDNIREVADRIILEKTEIQKGCLNLKSRYALSRKATKRTQVAVELRQDGKFEKVSCSALPMGIESLSSRSFKEFESRVSTMNEIIETLKNDQVSMIGICGVNSTKTRWKIRESIMLCTSNGDRISILEEF
ncbi:hypothetical protein TEA_004406 [Camellia sinensis var. sinensis]|uniref:Uncharacterized protein n=1 Tax=Camellia sinensis var. sinensis TaxID=542762 RepID=A0A4S4DG17_CAMSN|nr:hypothetical protein TEA_004406 [Camellia sinensis var. sinensis]